MGIITSIKSQYVLNIPDKDESLESIIKYISKYVQNWKEYHTIGDLRKFNLSIFNSESVRNFIQKVIPITKMREGLKTAVLVDSEFAFGMMRMFQLVSEDKSKIQINIFKDMSEVENWLLDDC